MKEVQADEVQARFVGRYAALMAGFAVRFEDRQFDPGQAVAKAGAPDDVRDVENASVLQRRESVHDATDPRHALNASSREIFRLDADEWRALRESNAISAPELPAPARSTPPGLNWPTFRYSLECICRMSARRTFANAARV